MDKTPMMFSKANAKSCIWEEISPCTSTGLGADRLQSSSADKDLEVPMDSKLTVSQQCALITERANGLLGCIRQSIDSR